MKEKSNTPIVAILAVIGVGLWVSFCQPFVNESTPAHNGRNLQFAIGLAKASKVYSLDHEGKAPAQLSDLSVEYLQHKMEVLLYRDPKSEKRMEWLYFPPADMADPKPGELMIAGSISYRGRRVAVFSDTSGKVITEKDFETQFAEASSKR